MFQKAAPPLPHQMSAGPEFACDFRVALPCRTLQHHPRSSSEELTGLVSAKPSFQDGSVTRGDLERLGSRHNRLTERVFTKLQPPPSNGNELLTRDTRSFGRRRSAERGGGGRRRLPQDDTKKGRNPNALTH